jgi:hypothetical protein
MKKENRFTMKTKYDLICDNCYKEFTVELFKREIVFDTRRMMLTFYTCTHCNTHYPVTLINKTIEDNIAKRNELAQKVNSGKYGQRQESKFRIQVDVISKKINAEHQKLLKKYKQRYRANNKKQFQE